ncbi:Na+/H+ antiporter subunit E [Cyanobacterium aponinum AL20118]|uniref:Multisubunit sodium/proton antiporter, MrpE subunit n=3 Tax=Cyanobacterium aponinum TaxID=379064 RepID=K9Z6C4_CYAAP|nr:Na+/H+ antiporter subunit E [Cyanobacterium aponinum]AFZ54292.1 multisubunit sodium/proton antiporter, MrpE subunit [Cyanobacterium aponinum PCC 10605]MBD2393899.1 Na+/H+ antiporter subunit E [Cyanobacterium aponinum FACHB-4101]MTF39563.1 cation:proton antiporter [Cyanobacterium aponinum 0216]PHV62079.1 cation:proton antiporter [Cyanobacterium aponinum IPPAS B-1201]WPF89043.1 Na+/H+ antiporter subunit E [Cyanobacterium aponinum AL20115]
MILHLIFRLGIWFLLTSDLSPANIMIGVAIAFILPKPRIGLADIKEWLKILAKMLIVFPQAYWEALEIMLFPHRYEGLNMEKVPAGRSPLLIFLDIFFITFTPKTVVVKYHKEGWYEVHRIDRKQLLTD